MLHLPNFSLIGLYFGISFSSVISRYVLKYPSRNWDGWGSKTLNPIFFRIWKLHNCLVVKYHIPRTLRHYIFKQVTFHHRKEISSSNNVLTVELEFLLSEAKGSSFDSRFLSFLTEAWSLYFWFRFYSLSVSV